MPYTEDNTPYVGGSATSRAAAESQTDAKKETDRARITRVLTAEELNGATCDEVSAREHRNHQTISARFRDMRDDGLILRTTQKRKTRNNVPADVHVLAKYRDQVEVAEDPPKKKSPWEIPNVLLGWKGVSMTNEEKIAICAEAGHEVNRLYCQSLGDLSQLLWEDAPSWQKQSAINGVTGAIAGASPQQSHDSWLREKEANGWKYGPVKDEQLKEHPCMVPYADLPEDQQLKDFLYLTTVRAMAAAVGLTDLPEA